MPDDSERRAELVSALGGLRARIAAGCADAGRDPHAVTLVAVTKTYPASDVAALVELGVHDVGENRDQEARAKVAQTAELIGAPAPPRWHFVGQLQSRKCRSVATYASAVHSFDRAELADRLADAVTAADRPNLDVFVQVSLDGDPDRGGVPVDAVLEVAAAVVARSQLRLRGVMAVAPLHSDADHEFARLAEISGRVRSSYPDADAISAGMSNDLEAALRHGATHVRVGTALLGRRAPLFG